MGPPNASQRNIRRPNTDRVNTTIAMIRPRLGVSLTMVQSAHRPSWLSTFEKSVRLSTVGLGPPWPSAPRSAVLTGPGRLASVPLRVVFSSGGIWPLIPPEIAASEEQLTPPAVTRLIEPWASRVLKIDVVSCAIQASQKR